jgi:RNA polymerase sigma-70 factor (ECF subfamily)
MEAAAQYVPVSPRAPVGLCLVPDGPPEEPSAPPGPTPSGIRAQAAELYRAYGPVVYRRCLRLLRSPDAARDATQDVFLKLVRDLSSLGDGAPVLPWLYRVASNHCLNLRRAGRHRGDGRPEGDLELLEAAPGASFPDRALAHQLLARFDEVTRLVAVGVLVDGMEHEEVAAVLGLSRRSVARKLERFLDGARRFLVVSGVDGRGDGGLVT